MTLKGFIIDRETLSDVSGVHVYNQHRMGTVSSGKGFFQMPVYPGDTITFSRIDYEVFTLIIEEGENYSEMLISMEQKVYILDSVDVYSGIPEPTHLYRKKLEPVFIPGVSREVSKEGDDYKTSVGEAVFSPATALYNAFSKKYKEEKKYHEIKQKEQQEDAEKKIGFDTLEEYLDTQEIIIPRESFEDLVYHCGVTFGWLAHANEYDIHLRMNSCILSFITGQPER